MRIAVLGLIIVIFTASSSHAAARSITMASAPQEVIAGSSVHLQCTATGDWRFPLVSAKVTIKNPSGTSLVSAQSMGISGSVANYDYSVPADAASGNWNFSCEIKDRRTGVIKSSTFAVAKAPTTPPAPPLVTGPIAAHNTITKYEGAVTCISCHAKEATDMLSSLHSKWKAPTPELTNTKGEELGKGVKGINTFCTYAMSSKNACFTCHIRSDGNAPHPMEAKDVDCLMCHSDTYQRKFVADPTNTKTVTNVLK